MKSKGESNIRILASNVLRAIAYVFKVSKRLEIAHLLLATLLGVLTPALLWAVKQVIDTIVNVVTDSEAGMSQLWLWIAVCSGLMILDLIAGSALDTVRKLQKALVRDRMIATVQDKSISLDMEHFEAPQNRDVRYRAQFDAPEVPGDVHATVMDGLRVVLALVGLLGLLAGLHWSIPILAVVASIPRFAVGVWSGKRQFRWRKGRTSEERRSDYLSLTMMDDMYAKEVRVFDLGPLLRSKYDQLRALLRREQAQLVVGEAVYALFASLVPLIVLLGVMAFATLQGVAGAVAVGSLVMYYTAFRASTSMTGGLLEDLASIYRHSLVLDDLESFLHTEKRVAAPERPHRLPQQMQDGIRFENVHFSYPNSPDQVLKGITMSIPPRSTVAIIGLNGAGKTTLIKLLCRLYDPTVGKITWDGVDLRDASPTDLRRRMAVIFQDYGRYNLTARENIWFGDVESECSDDKIVAAAKLASAHEVIDKLPKKYETILGRWFEEGVELSMGQWQRVAISRAMFRDAELLILDEPTSHLDPHAEFEIFSWLASERERGIRVLISHRFSTVRAADLVYVIEGGAIKEWGSHEDLMRQDGLYAKLFREQAAVFNRS